jgi:hypothetical protein
MFCWITGGALYKASVGARIVQDKINANMTYTLETYNGVHLFEYNPTLIGAVITAALFIIITLLHLIRMGKTRCWFCIPFILGGICKSIHTTQCALLTLAVEMVGYGARAAAHNNTGVLFPYIIQSTLLLVAPALFAASIYMALGRVMRSIGAEHLSPVRIGWLTKIFVVGDVLSFFVQSGGAGYQVNAKTSKDSDMGRTIILAGLFIQIVMFGFFIVTAVIFQHRAKKSIPRASYFGKRSSWCTCIKMLYAVSVLILTRSVFRVVEYLMGKDGYLLQQEWPLYAFDGFLMWIMMVIFFWWHPSQALETRPNSGIEFVPLND